MGFVRQDEGLHSPELEDSWFETPLRAARCMMAEDILYRICGRGDVSRFGLGKVWSVGVREFKADLFLVQASCLLGD